MELVLSTLSDNALYLYHFCQSITGWRSVVKWRIYHEHKARVIYSLTTYRQLVIYWATKHLLARLHDSFKK